MTDEHTQKTALLTNTQRLYLLGETDNSAAGERKLRARIRKRLAQTMVDLVIVQRNLDDSDIQSALADVDEETMVQVGEAIRQLDYQYRVQADDDAEVSVDERVDELEHRLADVENTLDVLAETIHEFMATNDD